MKIKFFLIIILSWFLLSCGSPQKTKPLDNSQVLAQNLAFNNFERAKELISLLKSTENTQNLVKLYIAMFEKGEVVLDKELNYLQQFIPEMNFVHKSMFVQMQEWLYLKQIYRQEISPPVRILQREKLYLAPSSIDFEKCLSAKTYCANDVRTKLLKILSNEEITEKLKEMARKDPCVNLSSTLKDEKKANRCLKSSKGKLSVELLSKPKFTVEEWFQAISYE